MTQEERGWPVLRLRRIEVGRSVGYEQADEDESIYPCETYHPESAPNVLSPEEARVLAHLVGLTAEERLILDRLSTYAKEQS